jgi:hypothetical protein
MHRVSRKVVLAAVGALALATLVAPAGAHNGKGGGKKPMGTVASFDGTTLTVTTADDDVTATVTEDTKVKVEHRGHHSKGKGHGNPSRGDAENLTAGSFVLDMKVDDDGNLVRIRVRSAAPHDPEPTSTPTETPTETPAPTETPTPTA